MIERIKDLIMREINEQEDINYKKIEVSIEDNILFIKYPSLPYDTNNIQLWDLSYYYNPETKEAIFEISPILGEFVYVKIKFEGFHFYDSIIVSDKEIEDKSMKDIRDLFRITIMRKDPFFIER